MEAAQRKIGIITSLGKKYSGMIDIPNDNFRTTDLFNSTHLYWKNPNMKCYDDAIFLREVSLFIDDKTIYKKFDAIQIKVSEIIFLYDEIATLCDENEKQRASVMTKQVQESRQKINFITGQVANSFYDITGIFSGMFLKKSKDKFVPLTQATVTEVYKSKGKWFQKTLNLPHGFLCVSNSYIESATIR